MNSVRFRLLTLALAPVVVLMPLLLFLGMARWTADYDEVLIAKVHSDLRIAEQYLARLMEDTGVRLDSIARSVDLQTVLREGQARQTLFLDAARDSLELDFLYLASPKDALASPWPVVVSAAEGTARREIDIFSADALADLDPLLAARADIALIDTEAAVPTTRTREDRGMVIHVATPVRVDGYQGVLVGGRLLNRNLDFIDTINDLVYRGTSEEALRQGTATLFLEDVRISTNVRLFEDVRALGTRVSAEVRDRVLGRGDTWLNRAFVVNDWYISGYLPLVDSFGKRVGMLYVGFLEAPFTTAKRFAYLWMVGAFALVVLASAPVFLWLARGIFAPLERMTQTMRRVGQGDLSARNELGPGGDEIAQVAGHLDGLLDQVQESDARLRAWADELNTRVDARTRELREANTKLEETFTQLVMREKLAAIGEITAGVAHEINNPVAVIQGNVDVIRDTLGQDADEISTELHLVDDQIGRIQAIVGKLLHFARPGEFAETTERVRIAPIVQDCLQLVDHVLARAQIDVQQDLREAPDVRMDPGELRQVMVNLILNAQQAMGEKGVLQISLRSEERDGLQGAEVQVCDTGPGIIAERLEDVFAPFYTTKRAEGTGLGLSISQTLVQRAGGQISARNCENGGACFSVWLPGL